MITLPPKLSDDGMEVRVLLAECLGPGDPRYNPSSATLCMQLMDLVLWNRVNHHPAQFLAKSPTLLGVITAKRQFQGFEHYPNYDAAIATNIQTLVDIANNPKDARNAKYANYLAIAMRIASLPTIPDPSPGLLAAWLTTGAPSPGANYSPYTTVLRNEFYYIKA